MPSVNIQNQTRNRHRRLGRARSRRQRQAARACPPGRATPRARSRTPRRRQRSSTPSGRASRASRRRRMRRTTKARSVTAVYCAGAECIDKRYNVSLTQVAGRTRGRFLNCAYLAYLAGCNSILPVQYTASILPVCRYTASTVYCQYQCTAGILPVYCPV